MSIKGKLGEFIPAANSPLAPLVFIAGGMKRTKEGQPAEYMLKRGFGNLKQFNIYNIAQTDFPEYGKQDKNVLEAWEECKNILKSQDITPSKFILVGFSLGAAHIEPLVTGQDGGKWDLVISAGAYMMQRGRTYEDHISIINKLTEYEDGNITKPKSSRFIYIHAAGVKDSDPSQNGDGQSLSIQRTIEKRIPSGNTYQHDSSNHMKTVNAAADWLDSNVIVAPDGTSRINVPTSKKAGREKVKTRKKLKKDEAKVETVLSKGPETGAAEKCNVEEKNNAVLKSQSDPKGAGDINKDTPPPSKNEKPQSTSNKYNHRFYIRPTLTLNDAALESPPSNPATLQKMVEKSGPWYNRYWAYRLNPGPNYGFEKYETTISDNGIELISAVIPYWRPPFPDEKNPKDDAIVKGNWVKLIDGQNQIQSPIDVPILLNAYQVGVFNDNIAYIYEAENELHMTILESEIINKGKLAIGQGLNDSDPLKKVSDSSWANYPRWSGIFASHCLRNSGFTLQENLGANIDFYHRSILSRDRLVNHPGNKKMPWKEMKTLGTQNKMFKPSKIWTEPKYLSEEEYFENDEKSSIAIFVIGYHVNRNGTLTDRGKKLVNHINGGLKWNMATISAVPHSTVNSSNCITDVLLYMDENGTIVTLGGNTNVPGANSSIKSGNHISVKVTNFAKFIPNLENFGVNASIIVAKTKSTPTLDFFRDGNGLDKKLVVNGDSIFNQYIAKVDSTTSREKINDEYYKKLLPYIVFGGSDCLGGVIGQMDGPSSQPDTPSEEPEYLPEIIVESAEMDKVNTDNCEQLRQKYNLTKTDTNIQGISATGVEGEIDNKDCKGGLTPLQIANLMAAIAGSESANRYSIIGGAGKKFTGRYQFGTDALIDTGFIKSGGNVNNPASWTGKLGIKSRKDFMDCPIVQEIAMQEFIKINYGYFYKAGAKIKKDVLDNMPCNELAGLLAVAHLLGFGGAQQYYNKGKNGEDAFGMSAAKYYKLGYGAASGKFQNKELKRPLPNTGEKYFLYPSVLQNGLGLGVTAPVIVQPEPQPDPNPDTPDAFDGDKFFKVNVQDIVFYAKSITTRTKVPILIKEMQEKYGKKNAINCSFYNGNGNIQFPEDSVTPPYKDESLSDLRVKTGGGGVATAFFIKNGVATIGASNAVPSDAKYVVAGTPVCIQNGIPRTETSVFKVSGRPTSFTGRVAIGIYNDGSVFIYVAKSKQAIQARNAILKYANGNNESGGDLKDVIFLDGGGSPFLYENNKFIFKNADRSLNNIIAW